MKNFVTVDAFEANGGKLTNERPLWMQLDKNDFREIGWYDEILNAQRNDGCVFVKNSFRSYEGSTELLYVEIDVMPIYK